MHWFYLFLTQAFSSVAITAMKKSDGFKKPLPVAITLVFFTLSFYFFSLSLDTLPMGLAYAIWCGASIFVVAMISRVIFHQSFHSYCYYGMCLILGGVILLTVFSKSRV